MLGSQALHSPPRGLVCSAQVQSSDRGVMQMRNLACALLLAHGVPMMQMGDEYGHSKVGTAPAAWSLCWQPAASAVRVAEPGGQAAICMAVCHVRSICLLPPACEPGM